MYVRTYIIVLAARTSSVLVIECHLWMIKDQTRLLSLQIVQAYKGAEPLTLAKFASVKVLEAASHTPVKYSGRKRSWIN